MSDDPRIVLPELERHLLKAEVRRDAAEVARLLSVEFREFGASGKVWTREQILAELVGEAGVQLDAEEFAVSLLSPGIVLVTYRSARMQAGFSTRRSLRSSVWRLEEGQWRMFFHQGTPMSEDNPI